MKEKSALSLLEMLIMVTVLAVAVALCLSVFVGAKRITDRTETRDFAISLAERGAEAVKAARGDLARTAEILTAEVQNGTVVLTDGEYTLSVTPRTEGYLGVATVSVTRDGATVAEITASYQMTAESEVRDG